MKKSIVLILFLLCKKEKVFANDTTLNFRINVVNINQQGKYRQMVSEAINLLNEILNSPEFKQEVINHHFDWTDLSNNGRSQMSGQQVFDTLYRWTQQANTWLYIEPRWKHPGTFGSGTYGITNPWQPSTTTIKNWLNLSPDKYQCTVIGYASHIAHEYCHQRGFYDRHPNPDTHRDVVPYAIGDIVCQLLNARLLSNCNCNE